MTLAASSATTAPGQELPPGAGPAGRVRILHDLARRPIALASAATFSAGSCSAVG